MNYSLVVMMCLSSNVLLAMQAVMSDHSRFEVVPRDTQDLVKGYLINDNSDLFKTALPPRSYKLEGHEGEVESVCLLPDRHVAVTVAEGTARFWNLQDLAKIELVNSMKKHHGIGPRVSISVSETGRWAFSGGSDNHVVLWDLQNLQTILTYRLTDLRVGGKDEIKSSDMTPDSNWGLTGSGEGKVRLWDLRNPKKACFYPLAGLTKSVKSVKLTPDRRWAIAGSDDDVMLWDLQNPERPLAYPLLGHTGSVNSVAISPDGKTAITGSEDGTARLWDLSNIETINSYELHGHTRPINSLSLTPDGRRALTGSSDHKVIVWDTKDRKNIRQHILEPELLGTVKVVLITPDGRWAVAGFEHKGNSIRLWDLKDLARILRYELEGHTDDVVALTITPNGRWLLSGSHDKTALLWDLSPANDLSLRDLMWIRLKRRYSLKESDKEFYLGRFRYPGHNEDLSYFEPPIPVS